MKWCKTSSSFSTLHELISRTLTYSLRELWWWWVGLKIEKQSGKQELIGRHEVLLEETIIIYEIPEFNINCPLVHKSTNSSNLLYKRHTSAPINVSKLMKQKTESETILLFPAMNCKSLMNLQADPMLMFATIACAWKRRWLVYI